MSDPGESNSPSSLTKRHEEYSLKSTQRAIAITCFLTVLSIVFVAARLATRIKVFKRLYADDWFMAAAGVFQIVYQVFITLSCRAALQPVPAHMQFNPDVIMWSICGEFPATTVSILARISGAILLNRIFGSVKWFKWYLVVLTVLQTILGILAIIFLGVAKMPIQSQWDASVPGHRYLDPSVELDTAIVANVLFTAADLTYVLFPILIIWKLNMPRRRKIGLALLLALSLFTMAASVLKALTTLLYDLNGFDYNDGLLWATIEQVLVIIIGSIPPLMPIAKADHPAVRCINNLIDRISARYGSRTSCADANFRDGGKYANVGIKTIGSQSLRRKTRHETTTVGRDSEEGLRGWEDCGEGANGVTMVTGDSVELRSQTTLPQKDIVRTEHFSISYDHGRTPDDAEPKRGT